MQSGSSLSRSVDADLPVRASVPRSGCTTCEQRDLETHAGSDPRRTPVGVIAADLRGLAHLAAVVLDEHTNDNGHCISCGRAFPCGRAALAEHNTALL